MTRAQDRSRGGRFAHAARVALFGLGLLATACGDSAGPNAAQPSTVETIYPVTTAAPAGTARTVEVVATDFGFQLPAAKVPAGPVALALVNKGAEVHQLTLVRLAGGVRAEDVVAGLRNGDAGVLAGTTSVGGPNAVRPGGKGSVSVDLSPGTYMMVCYIPSPKDQQAHSQKGMANSFTVDGPAPAPSGVAPSTRGTITITEGGYQVPAGLTSGSYRVVNEFDQPADAVLLKLRPGATAKDLSAFFAGGAVGSQPFTLSAAWPPCRPVPAPSSISRSPLVPTCSQRSRTSWPAAPPSSCPACC